MGDLLALAAPTIDGDGDGVPDRDDKCPADAETHNGYQDGDGCPDLVAPRGASPATIGQIVERIEFAHDSARPETAIVPGARCDRDRDQDASRSSFLSSRWRATRPTTSARP